MRPSPRQRRLESDLRALESLRAASSIVDFAASSSEPDGPVDLYIVRFRGPSFVRFANQPGVQVSFEHEVLIRLGASYPRQAPALAWRTPIFHPNISTSGAVCLGGYSTFWVPSLQLDQLCVMLWDMVRYHNYDVKSPYNREAAVWLAAQTGLRLPLDNRPLRNADSDTVLMAESLEAISPAMDSPRRTLPTDANELEVVDAEVLVVDQPEIVFID